MKSKINKTEIEALEKLINKIEKKTYMSYVGIGVGALIIILAIIYYMQNPDVIAGVISLGLIGIIIVIIYVYSLKSYKKRIIQLTKDLERTKEIFNDDNND